MNKAFKNQLWIGVGIVLVCSVLNTLFRHWIFSSIGFILCGLLWILHPVKLNPYLDEKRQLAECRVAGLLLILLGIMLRARLY